MGKQIIKRGPKLRATQSTINTKLKNCYIQNPIGLLNFLTEAGICRQTQQLFIQLSEISTKNVTYFVQGNCVLCNLEEIKLDLPFIVLEAVHGYIRYNAYVCSYAM